jgi:hypothetical protein
VEVVARPIAVLDNRCENAIGQSLRCTFQSVNPVSL